MSVVESGRPRKQRDGEGKKFKATKKGNMREKNYTRKTSGKEKRGGTGIPAG